MDEALRTTAEVVYDAIPCSVTLPAGTGKTQIITALSALGVERMQRVLVLTHTNAGVDAIRRRLSQFGVDPRAIRVETIASFSFRLVSRYPMLSKCSFGDAPDWSKSVEYYAGAVEAISSNALKLALPSSFDFVVVDEYQDCILEQHAVIVALSRILPSCIFGDPMQNIFQWGTNKTIDWDLDVVSRWPSRVLPVVPWRWIGHNDRLGQWLLDIRPKIMAREPIDLRRTPVNWVRGSSIVDLTKACYSHSTQGSVVAITRFSYDGAQVAASLNGSFSFMEELAGNILLKFAQVVDEGVPSSVASGTLQFARACMSRVAAKLDGAVLKKLAAGESVTHLKREGAEVQLELLSKLLSDPSAEQVRTALASIELLPGVAMFRREAWRDMLRALESAINSDTNVFDAVVKIRNQTRSTGRLRETRVVSRPLLIKGLEYDHAILLDADRHSLFSLYVALTRGRKSLTIVSRDPILNPSA